MAEKKFFVLNQNIILTKYRAAVTAYIYIQ